MQLRTIERIALCKLQVPVVYQTAPSIGACVSDMPANQIEKLIESLAIVVVDESQYTRKLTRMMLQTIGAKTIYEAGDGVAALDLTRNVNPDVLIMDWTLPLLSGGQVMRIVRSPGVFPKPNLPVIMLTACAQRMQVAEALRLGVHEFLLKPTSPGALRDRLISILFKPRPMVQIGKCYVPTPRRAAGQNNLQCAA
jgi:two-component system chemotaxis response regulator CheY